MTIKKIIYIKLILAVSFTSLSAQQVIDKVVAIVEDDIIMASELTQFSLNLSFQMGIDPRKDPDKFNQLQKETLNNLINQKILLVKAEEDSILVPDRQVDNVLEEQINNMILRVGSEQELEKQLGMPINKIKRTFREDVRDNLMVEMLRNTKYQEIQITRREIEEFYRTMKDSLPQLKETVDISHILIEVEPSESSQSQTREKIEELKKRVDAGEDFEKLCREYSEDPGSKDRGGELGYIERGDFVPEFEEVAFLLEPGEISDIVKTQFGFHIIQCIDRKGDKINVRHLLLMVQPAAGDEAATEAKVKEIREMLEKPDTEFREIAKEYSDDETTRKEGGHLGLFESENLTVKEFKDVIGGMEEGEISQPFKTKFGWHILKLNSRESAREISIEKDWERIQNWALNLKRQREFEKWVNKLKKDVYVEIKTTEDL